MVREDEDECDGNGLEYIAMVHGICICPHCECGRSLTFLEMQSEFCVFCCLLEFGMAFSALSGK